MASRCQTRWAIVVLWCSSVATAINAHLYPFALPALVSEWRTSIGVAGALGSISLLGLSMGPWLTALIGTRVAMIRIARVAIAWFAVFSCASAFAANMPQLIVLRGLMSLGLGMAWAAGNSCSTTDSCFMVLMNLV